MGRSKKFFKTEGKEEIWYFLQSSHKFDRN